jgi:Ca2+:H+ antiporter
VHTRRSHRDESQSLRGGDSEEEEEDDDEVGSTTGRRPDHGKSTAQGDEDSDTGDSDKDEDPITLKDRQSMINVEHPFGLPIWKPALYKKSRSVTRYADEALHSTPSASAEKHLLPGNILWVVFFGWWLAVACFAVSGILYCIPRSNRQYSSLAFGLGWYLAWPFGKYVEGLALDEKGNLQDDDEEAASPARERTVSESSDTNTVRGISPMAGHIDSQHTQSVSWSSVVSPGETTSLLARLSSPANTPPTKSYGAASPLSSPSIGGHDNTTSFADKVGKACFWLAFVCVIAPLMLAVCMVCWALIVTIPMARLNWALIKHIWDQPTSLRFCAAPPAVVVSSPANGDTSTNANGEPAPARFSIKHHRLSVGQVAPDGSPASTVLLCTYRAMGWKYYKYTVGGVNILFINLLPVVFLVIIDGLFILPMVERREHAGKRIPWLLAFIASRGLIFIMSLLSVIPLSYFIGMAVASISAQSSIGMGAVINATFGSLIEIILYSFALSDGKGRLVEGSIVGSLLAGVLLMPGLSMISGALRRKELKFNAKSAGVTSLMLIMAIIGTLTPTMFYQTYGNFSLVCSGCPSTPTKDGKTPFDSPWICEHCYYEHPDPVDDPFYQSTVKSLMYFCASILLFSYLIGLWFSLRTHASQIWQNPQQLLQPMELPVHAMNRPLSLYQRMSSQGPVHRIRHQSSYLQPSASEQHASAQPSSSSSSYPQNMPPSPTPGFQRRVSYAPTPNIGGGAGGGGGPVAAAYSPVLESVKSTAASLQAHGANLPQSMSTDEFTRAVAVATVSALRHQQQHMAIPGQVRTSGADAASAAGGHGGHDAPEWSRMTSASVLLTCTALYAIIAEILVDVVDVILEGSGIDEKFLGVTLFALVPNTTEFMNAMSFALNGNISLSMEIGSAYALQVCLLQIPAMVAFSAWYAPEKMGEVAHTFTLIFPRWDVIVIILSMFLLTYTYIEAKSNYHRGSILTLSYLVLTSGFYFAPHTPGHVEGGHTSWAVVEAQKEAMRVPMTMMKEIMYWVYSAWTS